MSNHVLHVRSVLKAKGMSQSGELLGTIFSAVHRGWAIKFRIGTVSHQLHIDMLDLNTNLKVSRIVADAELANSQRGPEAIVCSTIYEMMGNPT